VVACLFGGRDRTTTRKVERKEKGKAHGEGERMGSGMTGREVLC
jgi:hypothetical protein